MVMRICFLLENCYVSTYKLKLIFDYLRAITLLLKKITSRVKNKRPSYRYLCNYLDKSTEHRNVAGGK